MRNIILKKIDLLIGLFPLAAIFGLVAFIGNIEVKDLDLWLHLAMGKFILQNGYVPSVDMLSCSYAGTPWVNHEWLFQIVIYKIYSLFGIDGILKMQVVVVVFTMFFLLLLGYNRDNQFIVSFMLLLVFLSYVQRFTTRPDLFSLLFFAMYIFILALHIDKKWAAVSLFVLQVIWTNMHGFFFFGPLFILIGLGSEWIKRHVKLPYEWNESGRLTDDEYKRLKFACVLVFGACLLNPLFIEGALYPVNVFFSLGGENKIFFEYIQELQKPIEKGTFFEAGRFLYFKIIIVLSALSFIFNRRKIDISAFIFWIVFLIFSLKAARNVSFFAFAAYLVFITNAISIDWEDIIPIRFADRRFYHLTIAIFNVLLLVWILNYAYHISRRVYYDFDKYDFKSEFGGMTLSGYPDKAADFLVKNEVKGNFFNDFNSGAYLLGRAYPNIKVFIDGRTEVYGGKFFRIYQKIWEKGDEKVFEEAVKKYQLTGVFLNATRHHIPSRILNYLYKHEDWKLVYFDYDAAVFLKDVEQNKKVIDEHEINLDDYETKTYDLFKVGSSQVLPYRSYFRAYALETLGFDDAALKEAQEALNVAPAYADPYHLIGKIYAKRKDHQNAFKNFRVAVSLAGHDKEAHFNLAQSYYDLEQYDEAIKYYQKISAIWPSDKYVRFLLTKCYAKAKKFDEMFSSLDAALNVSPQSLGDVLTIGDVLLEQGDFEEARKVFERALKVDPDFSKTYLKIGDSYKGQDNESEAKRYYEKAQSLDSMNQTVNAVME